MSAACTADTPIASLKVLIAVMTLACVVPDANVNCCTPSLPEISKVSDPLPPLSNAAPVDRKTPATEAAVTVSIVTLMNDPGASDRRADWMSMLSILPRSAITVDVL